MRSLYITLRVYMYNAVSANILQQMYISRNESIYHATSVYIMERMYFHYLITRTILNAVAESVNHNCRVW